MIAMHRPDDEGERPELDEFTQRRVRKLGFWGVFKEWQDLIAEYNERNRRQAEE